MKKLIAITLLLGASPARACGGLLRDLIDPKLPPPAADVLVQGRREHSGICSDPLPLPAGGGSSRTEPRWCSDPTGSCERGGD
jgi:hypothetical protein